MKLRCFQQKMPKAAFTFREAALVERESSLPGLRLRLHRWVKQGALLRIRREVYAFPERPVTLAEQIRALYFPAYVSLETALSLQGLLPDVPFENTLVTTRATRFFQTVWGRFRFRHIHPRLFLGYDPQTLLAEPEKTVLDFLYYYRCRLQPAESYWQEGRWQNLHQIRWARGKGYLPLYKNQAVERLWFSLRDYAKTHPTFD